MTRKLGRLAITVFLILAIALTLDAYNLPTGIGEKVLQRTTEETSEKRERSTSSSSSSGPCPPGVVCSSSSSSSSRESTSSSASTGASSGSSTSESSSSSLTFRTMPSSSTPEPGGGPGCSYWGILPGTVRNVTSTTTIITIFGTGTNQTNSTVVETVVETCAIPGFPLEGTIVGMVVGLLFVIMSRSKSRRLKLSSL